MKLRRFELSRRPIWRTDVAPKRFSEEQITGILKEHERSAPAFDLCRKHGMAYPTFYARKAKFGGLKASDAKKLKALEEENARLTRLLADASSNRRR
ncbi:MAG: hypothetical protein EBZ50_14500 [Alphaproteobacteria bacterium]|nr:hypothetical protein [Alphaproteobacteria bacterium]